MRAPRSDIHASSSQPKPEISPEFEEDYPIDDIDPSLEETSFEVHDTAKKVEPISKFSMEGKFRGFEIEKRKTSKAASAAFKMLRSRQGAKQAFIMKEIFDRPYS